MAVAYVIDIKEWVDGCINTNDSSVCLVEVKIEISIRYDPHLIISHHITSAACEQRRSSVF